MTRLKKWLENAGFVEKLSFPTILVKDDVGILLEPDLEAMTECENIFLNSHGINFIESAYLKDGVYYWYMFDMEWMPYKTFKRLLKIILRDTPKLKEQEQKNLDEFVKRQKEKEGK